VTGRIAVAGLPFFGQRVAQSLRTQGFDATFVPTPGAAWLRNPRLPTALLRADLVYAIGSSVRLHGPLDLLARAGRPILMHWVGTDVLQALRAREERKLSPRVITGAHHWVDAPWFIDELAPLGLRASEHPLPMPIAVGRPLPMPPDPAVLVYIPRKPHAAYNVEGTFEVIDALPGVRFLVAGGYPLTTARPNVEDLGYVTDWEPVYERTGVFLRLAHHDGISHTLVEALSFGRHAVWSFPFPGVHQVSSPAQAVHALRELLAAPLALNQEGLQASDRYRAERILPETAAELRAIIR